MQTLEMRTSKATVGKIMEVWRPVCLQAFSCNEGNWWDLHYASHGQTMALMQTGAWWMTTKLFSTGVLLLFRTPEKFIGFDWRVAAYANVWGQCMGKCCHR